MEANQNNEFRKLRRFKQATTLEECKEVLSVAPRGFLSLHGENGYPYTIPLNFIFFEDKIYFHCAKNGHKIDALRANSKASFTTLSEGLKKENEWWYTFVSVICFGNIKEVNDAELSKLILRKIGGKYFPEDYDIEKDLQDNAPQATILEFTIDHISGKRVKEK